MVLNEAPARVPWRDACRVTNVLEERTKGPWRVERFTVTKEHAILQFREMLTGRDCPPGEYTRLMHEKRGVVMSDTRAEINDLAWLFYSNPRGRVLVNGLGLGCVLSGLLNIEEVESIDVVEIDPDVIELVGSQIKDPRLTIHEADAFKIKWPVGVTWDFVWHDVWDELSTDNLNGEDARPGSYATLHRRYGRRTTWQGSWGFELLRSERRRYSAYGW